MATPGWHSEALLSHCVQARPWACWAKVGET